LKTLTLILTLMTFWKALAAPFQQTLKHYNTGNLCSSGKVIC
jgi:hypothetical protein